MLYYLNMDACGLEHTQVKTEQGSVGFNDFKEVCPGEGKPASGIGAVVSYDQTLIFTCIDWSSPWVPCVVITVLSSYTWSSTIYKCVLCVRVLPLGPSREWSIRSRVGEVSPRTFVLYVRKEKISLEMRRNAFDTGHATDGCWTAVRS